MTQRGGPQNFSFRYAPLRLRSPANQPNSSPRVRLNAPAGNQMPFSPRASLNAPNNLAIQSSETTESEVSENYLSPMNILSSSLENIASLFQRQEHRNGEIQTELVAARNEIGRLKTQSDSSLAEIEQLRYVNQKLNVKFN